MDVEGLLINSIDSEVLAILPQIPICATGIHGANLIIHGLLGESPVVDQQVALVLIRIFNVWALPSTPLAAARPTTLVIKRTMKGVGWIQRAYVVALGTASSTCTSTAK
jgi:hypothetical protein